MRQVNDLNKFCYKYERSYEMDEEIKSIVNNGITSQSMLNAARLIRDREKSRFLKLPVNLTAGLHYQPKVSIAELTQIAEAIYGEQETGLALKSIELAEREEIMLRVLGPFSALMEAVGSNLLFKWLCRHTEEVQLALTKITENLSVYIEAAIGRGAAIISLAEPSVLTEVLGEERCRDNVLLHTVRLMRVLESPLDNGILHLCPRTSYQLEDFGLIRREKVGCSKQTYAAALSESVQNRDIKYVGHGCIHGENRIVDKLYVLKLL